MNNHKPWAARRRVLAGRPWALTVLVHGSDIVVAASPGEVARLDTTGTEQFRSAIATAVEVTATRAPGWPGPSEEIDTASTVKQYRDDLPPVVVTRAASPSCRGGTTAPVPGSAATPGQPA